MTTSVPSKIEENFVETFIFQPSPWFKHVLSTEHLIRQKNQQTDKLKQINLRTLTLGSAFMSPSSPSSSFDFVPPVSRYLMSDRNEVKTG